MPRVPVYEQQVRQRPLPVTQAANPPNDLGLVALGQGAQEFARSMSAVADRKRQQAQVARLTDLDNQANEFEINQEYGDNGFRKHDDAKGLKAVGAATRYTSQYAEHLKQIGADLDDPELATRWQQMASRRLQSFSERANRYEAEQVDVGEKATMQGAIESARQMVVNDPARLPDALKKSGAAVRSYYAAQGLDPDATQPYLADADRLLVESAYQQLDDADTAGQRRMLETFGGLMDPGFYRRAQDALGVSSKRNDAIAAGTEAWTKARGDVTRALAGVDAMVSAGKITAEQGEVARDSVAGRSVDADRARKERLDSLERTVTEQFVAGGYQFAAIDRRALHRLMLEDPTAVSRYLAIEKNLKQGLTVDSLGEVDPETMARLAAYLQLPEDQQVKANLIDFADKLPRNEYLQIVERQGRLRDTIERAGFQAQEQAFTESKKQIVEREFIAAGLKDKKGKVRDEQRFAQATLAIETGLAREAATLKRGEKLSPEAVRKVVQGALVQGTIGAPEPGRAGQLSRGLGRIPVVGMFVPQRPRGFAFEAGLGDEFTPDNPNGPAPYFVGYSGLDQAAVKTITDGFRARFRREPTREEVLGIYQDMQDHAGGGAAK